MSVVYERAQLSVVRERAASLVERYHAMRDAMSPVKIRWDKYAEAEDRDLLRVYIARHDTDIIAVSMHLVTHGLHYGETMMASCDTFIATDADVSVALIEFSDGELRREGVEISTRSGLAAPLPDTYEPIDRIMGKRLGEL